MVVYGTIEEDCVAALCQVKKLMPRQRYAGTFGKCAQKGELGGAQRDGDILVVQQFALSGVEYPAIKSQTFRHPVDISRWQPCAAPEHRFYPCKQLPWIERLGDVVVYADLQPDDPVHLVSQCGKQDNRDILFLAQERGRDVSLDGPGPDHLAPNSEPYDDFRLGLADTGGEAGPLLSLDPNVGAGIDDTEKNHKQSTGVIDAGMVYGADTATIAALRGAAGYLRVKDGAIADADDANMCTGGFVGYGIPTVSSENVISASERDRRNSPFSIDCFRDVNSVRSTDTLALHDTRVNRSGVGRFEGIELIRRWFAQAMATA